MKRRRAVIFLLVFAALAVFVFGFSFAPIDRHSTKPIVFIVQKGQGSSEIAHNLEREGFVRFALLFKVLVFVSGLSHRLQAGAYELNPSMNAMQIAKKIAEGNVIKEFITIPDGWTSEDIAKEFERQKFFTAKDFLASEGNLEGYLFPDTYQISRTQTMQEIASQMVQNFNKHFTKTLRNETARQRKTISQVVAMASILEKEVQTPQDKKIVSGILWKRIKNGIPLQVDASSGTYLRQGLPINPISNPGMDSILAVLYPTPSPYLYYLSTKSGKTIFSATLEEHNTAKAKYLGH